jgi:hypothetical protein
MGGRMRGNPPACAMPIIDRILKADKTAIWRKLYFLILGFIMGYTIAMAQASLSGGTYYNYLYLTDRFIVSADTRASGTSGPAKTSDRYCKVIPLSDRIIFFSRDLGNVTGPGVSFDVNDSAREAYRKGGPEIVKIGEEWGEIVSSVVAALPEQELARYKNGEISTGYFAVSADSEIKLIRMQVTRHSNNTTHKGTTMVPPQLVSLGYEGTFSKALQGAGQPDIRVSTIEQQAEILQRATETVIGEAISQNGSKSYIGGEAVVMILEAGHNWRWFRRPDFCP